MDLVLKRIMAYIIDILIVSIVVSLFVGQSFINPYIDEYDKYYSEYMDLYQQVQDGEVDTETDEYKDNVIELSYNVNKYKVVSSSISLVATFLYFAIVQWAMNGQTLGKKIMKIRVVANKEDRKLNVGNYMLRSIILNNVIFSIMLIVGVYVFKANVYYNFMSVVSYLQLLVTTIIMLMVVLRKDFRGLHDFVAGTKVIDLNPVIIEDPVAKEKNEEKKVIETKEVEVKEVKKKTSTKNKSKKKSTGSKAKSKREKE